MSSIVVLLVRVILLPQFRRLIPVLNIITGVDYSVYGDLTYQVVDMIFDIVDL